MADKKLKREFEYKLKEPVSIHKEGQNVLAKAITMKAPTMAQHPDRCILKEIVMHAVRLQQDDARKEEQRPSSSENNEDDEANKSEQLITLISMYQPGEEVIKLSDAFVRIITKTATIDSVKLTELTLQKIDSREIESMLGEFLVNFILPT